MTTSNIPILLPPRVPVRLRMADHPGRGRLDGGWWPQSRVLAIELADLVEHFPPGLGRIVRVHLSPSDWDPAPRRISVANDYVEVRSLPRADAHVIRLKTSDRKVLRLLVVPPGMSRDQGGEALLAAATLGYAHTASSLLDTVTEHPDIDPHDLWNDEGEAWWGPHPVAPSSR